MTEKQYYVYILTNYTKTALYTGVTSNLVKRVWEHKNHVVDGFTSQYDVTSLIYFEVYVDPETAIKREKRLKRWNRSWKDELITKFNPTWRDLYGDIIR